MARYRKLYPCFWRDDKILDLVPEGKLVACYCLTGPQTNRIGLYVLSVGQAAEECGMDAKRFDTVCDTVCDTLLWARDKRRRILFIRSWWRWNRPDNEKAMIGALSDLSEVTQTHLRQEFAQNTSHLSEHLADVLNTLCHTLCHTVSPQEQEQEQEQEQDITTTHATPDSPGLIAQIEQAWNATAGVKKIRRITPDRKSLLRTRLKDDGWDWRAALAKFPLKCFASEPEGWRPTFDWFIRTGTVDGILEGKYDWTKDARDAVDAKGTYTTESGFVLPYQPRAATEEELDMLLGPDRVRTVDP